MGIVAVVRMVAGSCARLPVRAGRAMAQDRVAALDALVADGDARSWDQLVDLVVGRTVREDGNDVRVVRGTIQYVTRDGEGIAFDDEGYLIGTGLAWRGFDGSWREGGQPECLPAFTSGAVVELGLMAVPGRHEAGGQLNHVVWVKCISPPMAVMSEP